MSEERKRSPLVQRAVQAGTVARIRSCGKSVPQVCRHVDLVESVARRWIAQAEIAPASAMA